ncbi:GSCFA domain-containing protein [Limnovirga soli]|uniref:GSCFA domain-containing protein n=1 Tax=Limnovirga soli TaxID=2656915 RepID=A0A8J8JSL8_9BACT|nr:GSCFA domain-containing protein [Limnovirga soli]NNV54215.1 GSCFA domain-containing protein [Limnovirga soli]
MQFFAPITIKPLDQPITYKDNLLLTGSCFTEHIGNHLMDVKFNVLQNPNGILFDTPSVCRSILSYIENRQYTADDLFYHNESWHCWQYHSRFSHPDQATCLAMINASQQQAHAFLQKADWLIITLGSSFSYKLAQDLMPVSNCHKVPATQFIKHLNSIEETVTALDTTIHQLFHFNKKIKIIFTISPVRHLRDGVIDNNRSKARLIEAVHHLVNKFSRLYYFPAYELVVDVLRDYRFYDIDLAHPNYAATQFVLEKFAECCFNNATITQMEEIRKIAMAMQHKPFNPASQQHKQFLKTQLQRTQLLQEQNPWLDFTKELNYFAS